MELKSQNELKKAFPIGKFKYISIYSLNFIMSRKGVAGEMASKPDPIYRNRLISMLVNRILKNGKRWDVSVIASDYNEAFFENDGLGKLKSAIEKGIAFPEVTRTL